MTTFFFVFLVQLHQKMSNDQIFFYLSQIGIPCAICALLVYIYSVQLECARLNLH